MQQPCGYDPEFYQLWQTLLSLWRMVRIFFLSFGKLGLRRDRYMTFLKDGCAPVDQALEQLDWVLDEGWVLHVRDLSLKWF